LSVIIWRGWGVLGAVYGLLAAMLGGGVASAFVDDSVVPVTAGAGFLCAAVATWFTGVALNRTSPQRRVEEWAGRRRAQLDELVASGRFSLGPGQPQPRSLDEARQMADDLFAHERLATTRAFNQHTLFWIPVQFFAVVWGAIGVVAVVTGLTRMAG